MHKGRNGMSRIGMALLIAVIVSLAFGSASAFAADYPGKPIEILVPWAQGGTTDNMGRTYQTLFEKAIGGTTYLKNMGGASGAVGTEYVNSKPADGYTVMVTSYQPAGVFQVMNLSKLGLDDFETIAIISFGVPSIAVHKDARWRTAQELIDEAKKNPGTINAGYSGPATMGQICAFIIEKYTGAKFNMVPFSGGGPVVTATLGKHVDVNFQALAENMDQYLGGNFRLLGTFSNEQIKGLDKVPALGQVFPDMKPYLPWGQWIGVMVKKGTPKEIVQKLQDVSRTVLAQKEWKDYCASMRNDPMALIGEEAKAYAKNWSSFTAWVLYEAGAATKSPELFGIPKP